MDNFLFGFQMGLFYVTFVGGIVSFFFSEKIPIPLWGIILIWIMAMAIEIVFLIITVRLLPENDEPYVDEAEAVMKELEELEKQNSSRSRPS